MLHLWDKTSREKRPKVLFEWKAQILCSISLYNWFEMEMVSERVEFKSQMLGTVFLPVGNIFESTIKQLLVRFLYGMENYVDLKECCQPRLKVKLLINTR